MKLTVLPVTPERWIDLEAIFKAKGCSVARGCWCMAYRLSGSQAPPPPGSTRAEVNRTHLKKLVEAGRPSGLIGYRGKVPVGWVSIGPREEYARLTRSPVMKPIDDQLVWSVICFVVPAEYRGQASHARFLPVPWPTPRNTEPNSLRPILSTDRAARRTIPCGLARNPCMTRRVFRK